MSNLEAEKTDWLSSSEQQNWFDKFKAQDVAGLKLSQFQQFLQATIYQYFAKFPHSSKIQSNGSQNDNLKFTLQQEMQLFKLFDTRSDHVIDRDEFTIVCQDWLDKTYRYNCALIIVDVQNDFIDGSLALINGPARQDGAQVVPVINNILDKCKFDAVVYTQDWHPINHIGFHENLHLRKYVPKESISILSQKNHNYSSELAKESSDSQESTSENNNKFKLKRLTTKVQVFDTVLFDDGRVEQKLWPVHCVQNSWGAQLHPKLKVLPNSVRVLKGTLSHIDAYSAFWDNMRLNETGLRHELATRNITDVFFCGLALDYCVSASAIDSAKAGFITFVVEDACRGIDEKEIERCKQDMASHGIIFINSCNINTYLSQSTKNHSITDGPNKNTLAHDTYQQANVVDFDGGLNGSLMMEVCYRKALKLADNF